MSTAWPIRDCPEKPAVSMSEIFETACPNLRMVAMVEPGPDREQQNAHGLASAIMLSFCVIGVVSASVSFCTRLSCYWV